MKRLIVAAIVGAIASLSASADAETRQRIGSTSGTGSMTADLRSVVTRSARRRQRAGSSSVEFGKGDHPAPAFLCLVVEWKHALCHTLAHLGGADFR